MGIFGSEHVKADYIRLTRIFIPKMSNQYFHSNIYAIAEDNQGEMWVGTRGNGLKVGDSWYRNEVSDPASLSENNVFSLFVTGKTVCG